MAWEWVPNRTGDAGFAGRIVEKLAQRRRGGCYVIHCSAVHLTVALCWHNTRSSAVSRQLSAGKDVRAFPRGSVVNSYCDAKFGSGLFFVF